MGDHLGILATNPCHTFNKSNYSNSPHPHSTRLMTLVVEVLISKKKN